MLTVLMKARPKSGSDLLDQQNLQATVNQLLEDQRDNSISLKSCSTNVAASNEFNSLEWSKDAFTNLFPVINYSKSYGSEVIQRWEGISKVIKSENSTLQDLVSKCTTCLKEFECLQSCICLF
jgi:hypothetical protein